MRYPIQASTKDPVRLAEWRACFLAEVIPVTNHIPEKLSIVTSPHNRAMRNAYAYLTDIEKLESHQQVKAILYLADKFGICQNFVRDYMFIYGIPILAEWVIVKTKDGYTSTHANGRTIIIGPGEVHIILKSD